MTGATLWAYTQGLIDKDFSDYVSSAKANRIFDKALFTLIESKLAALDSQKIYDELSFLIKSNVFVDVQNNRINCLPMYISNILIPSANVAAIYPITPHNLQVGSIVNISGVTGTVNVSGSYLVVLASTNPNVFTVSAAGVSGAYTGGGYCSGVNQLTDYYRLLAVKAVMPETLTGVYVTGATNATPIVVELSERTKIRTGDYVTISGVNGNAASNGSWYVKQLSKKRYELYADASFTSPAASSGTFTSSTSSTVKIVWSNYCTPQFANRKISSLSQPTPARPMYEDSGISIQVLPSTSICSGAYVDYVTRPSVKMMSMIQLMT